MLSCAAASILGQAKRRFRRPVAERRLNCGFVKVYAPQMDTLPLEILVAICQELPSAVAAESTCHALATACRYAFYGKIERLNLQLAGSGSRQRQPEWSRQRSAVLAQLEAWKVWKLSKITDDSEMLKYMRSEDSEILVTVGRTGRESYRADKLRSALSRAVFRVLRLTGNSKVAEMATEFFTRSSPIAMRLVSYFDADTLARYIIQGANFPPLQERKKHITLFIEDLFEMGVPIKYTLAIWLTAADNGVCMPQNFNTVASEILLSVKTREDYEALGEMAHWCSAACLDIMYNVDGKFIYLPKQFTREATEDYIAAHVPSLTPVQISDAARVATRACTIKFCNNESIVTSYKHIKLADFDGSRNITFE